MMRSGHLTLPSDGMTNVRPDWSHQRTSEVQPPSGHRRRSVGHGPAPRGLCDVITPRSVSSLSHCPRNLSRLLSPCLRDHLMSLMGLCLGCTDDGGSITGVLSQVMTMSLSRHHHDALQSTTLSESLISTSHMNCISNCYREIYLMNPFCYSSLKMINLVRTSSI